MKIAAVVLLPLAIALISSCSEKPAVTTGDETEVNQTPGAEPAAAGKKADPGFQPTQVEPAQPKVAPDANADSEARKEKDGSDGQAAKSELAPNSAARSEAREEKESQPEEQDIGEDCVAFLQATKAFPPADATSSGCPTCPAKEGSAVLKVSTVTVDGVTPSPDRCEVNATIRATFNPSAHLPITGGLTGWIPKEQREKFERGETPEGEQVYHLKITYRRTPKGGWKPVEFAPAPPR
jgi:hypothetical protein